MGAYGGKREIMRMVSPDGPVYQAGTLSGNPVATAAGIETLKILKEDPAIYQRLEIKTKKLAQAVKEAAGDKVYVNQIGSLMSVFFTSREVKNYEDAVSSDTEKYARYFQDMLERGIYLAPAQFEAMFVSDAHTEDDIEKTCHMMKESLCSLDL